MKLTKKQAIEEHRKLWNWIADETLKRKRKVEKPEYFDEVDPYLCMGSIPQGFCFCCEYDKAVLGSCRSCPIVWPCDDCFCSHSPYYKWNDEQNYEKAAMYARRIAKLPERKDTEFDLTGGSK